MAIKFTINGHTIFCATGGQPFESNRRAVILLHGAGMDHTTWSLQSRWFAWHGWSVLVPDLPGHRNSTGEPLPSIEAMATWLGQLMDTAALQTATLVGHSMGGIVALQTAAAMPERVRHIALLGVADAMPVHPDLLAAAQANNPLAYDLVTSWAHGRGAHLGRNQQPGIWMMGNTRQLLARNRPGVLYSDLNACNNWQGGLDTAEKVKCPTLFIIGDSDVMTPPQRAKQLAAAIPGSKQIILTDCGHMMMQEQPDQTLDALIGEFQN